MKLIRFGTEYGGYYLPQDAILNSNSIIYSIGIGEDLSFDVELSAKYGSKIYMYDPTPRSIKHVEDIKLFLNNKLNIENNKRYGGGDINYLNNIRKSGCKDSHLIFDNIAISDKNGYIDFYFPTNDNWVSCSIEKYGRDENNKISVQTKTIATLMQENNHKHIDVLKLDIENSEYAVLMDMFDDNIYPTYICIDFDGIRNNFLKDQQKIKILDRILKKYSVIYNSNFDMTFALK